MTVSKELVWQLTCCGTTADRGPDSGTFNPDEDYIFSPRDPDRNVDPMMYNGIVHYDGACPGCGEGEPAVEPSVRIVIRK